MQQVEEHINRIAGKLQELLKKHAALVKQSEQDQKTIHKLEQQQALQLDKIRVLEEQQHILRASAGKMEGVDKKEFEQLISKYLRDIDKCIHLLND